MMDGEVDLLQALRLIEVELRVKPRRVLELERELRIIRDQSDPANPHASENIGAIHERARRVLG